MLHVALIGTVCRIRDCNVLLSQMTWQQNAMRSADEENGAVTLMPKTTADHGNCAIECTQSHMCACKYEIKKITKGQLLFAPLVVMSSCLAHSLRRSLSTHHLAVSNVMWSCCV